jgi:hypothetical protein
MKTLNMSPKNILSIFDSSCLSPLVALTGFSWSHGEAFNDVDSDVAKHLFLYEIFKHNMVTCRFCHEELSKMERIFLGDIGR